MLWRKIKQVKGDGEYQSLKKGFAILVRLGKN